MAASGDPQRGIAMRFRAADLAGNIIEFDPRILSKFWWNEFEDGYAHVFAPSRIEEADFRWKLENQRLENARREQKNTGGVNADGTISYVVETLQEALAATLEPRPPPSLVMLFPLEWPAEHSGLELGDETMAEEALAWQTTWVLEKEKMDVPAHFRFAIEGPDRFRPACKDLVLALSSGRNFWLGFRHHFGHQNSDFVIDRELLLTSCVKFYEARGNDNGYSINPIRPSGGDISIFSIALVDVLPEELLVRSLPVLFPGGELVWPADLFENLKLMHTAPNEPYNRFWRGIRASQGEPYSSAERAGLMAACWSVVTRAIKKREDGGDVLKNVFGSTEAALHKALRCLGDAEKTYNLDPNFWRSEEASPSRWKAADLTMAIYEQLKRQKGFEEVGREYLRWAGEKEGVPEWWLTELVYRR